MQTPSSTQTIETCAIDDKSFKESNPAPLFSRKRGRKLKRDTVGDYVIIGILIIFAFLTVFPMWYVVVGSFSDGNDYMKGGVFLWPRIFTLSNYKVIFSNEEVWSSLFVTFARCAIAPTIEVLFTSFVAYGMSRRELPFKKFFNFVNLFVMFFGGGLIPYYLLCKILGLLNNFLIYILPGAYGVYNMILVRSFFKNTPEELHEAAVIDGANEFYIYFNIMIPLSLPILMTIFTWSLIGHWNDYLTSMMYMPTAPQLHTLQYVLQKIIAQNDMSGMDSLLGAHKGVTGQSVSFAAMVFGILPMLVVFPFLQKFLTKGIYVGSLKG